MTCNEQYHDFEVADVGYNLAAGDYVILYCRRCGVTKTNYTRTEPFLRKALVDTAKDIKDVINHRRGTHRRRLKRK